jgi:hypothetical protein
MANAGTIAIIAKNTDPGNVILDNTPSMNSEVCFPGFIPGINPPFLFISSDICVGLIVMAV